MSPNLTNHSMHQTLRILPFAAILASCSVPGAYAPAGLQVADDAGPSTAVRLQFARSMASSDESFMGQDVVNFFGADAANGIGVEVSKPLWFDGALGVVGGATYTGSKDDEFGAEFSRLEVHVGAEGRWAPVPEKPNSYLFAQLGAQYAAAEFSAAGSVDGTDVGVYFALGGQVEVSNGIALTAQFRPLETTSVVAGTNVDSKTFLLGLSFSL